LQIDDLEKTIEPLFVTFKSTRQLDESFGDFCHRVGFDMLREAIAIYQPPVENVGKSKVRRRIDMADGLYERLKAAAVAQGKPMTEIATVAIEAYLETL